MQSKITDEIREEQGFSTTIEKRFWEKVIIQEGCWGWNAATQNKGYGVIGRGEECDGLITAHRLSWMIHNGRIPDGLCILHDCDNPPCTNPDHLHAGTHKQNTAEAKQRNRLRIGLKLTEEIVAQIRSLEGTDTATNIGKKFGIVGGMVNRIFNGVHWTRNYVPHEVKKMSYKLNERDIPKIREMLKTMSQSEVATHFGVTRTGIQAVANGRTWKHIV